MTDQSPATPSASPEYSFVLIKPDAINKDITLTVLGRIENAQKDARIVASKIIDQLSDDVLADHYRHLTDKPFYPGIVEYMQSHPVWVAVIRGQQGVVQSIRDVLGSTDPRKAAPGTIRQVFGEVTPDDAMHNVAHASDSPETALDEIRRFFDEKELREQNHELANIVYGPEKHSEEVL